MSDSLIVLFVLLLPVVIWLSVRQLRLNAEETRRQRRLAEEFERERLDRCSDVIQYFANNLGYVARSAISREELSTQMDSGASPEELCVFITQRVLSVDGLRLGFQPTVGGNFPVILPTDHRNRHLYVIGKSGYGKTNLIRNLIQQDLEHGSGIGVLAPEFEMLRDEILPFIPESRIDDVIYLNPADVDCPVVLNPLHLDQGEDIDLRVDETFTIFQRLVGEGGPRMDEILRHSLYALCERQGSTLLDFEPLLDRQNDSFRREIISTTRDEQTRNFFDRIYPQLPKDAHIPIVNRVGRIIRARYVRNCLCPPQRTTLTSNQVGEKCMNIRRAMDAGKILLFNLSDGILGEAASQLIGQLIVSKIQSATMSRADEPQSSRMPFYLYLDEFQNFIGLAGTSYEKLLSRGRKYGLSLILSHQQLGQLHVEVLREIFGNVSTMVSFQVAHADAAKLAKEFVAEIDMEIQHPEPEDFLKLGIGEAICRIAKNSFYMSVPLADQNSNTARAQQVIMRSRELYGVPRIFDSQRPIYDRGAQASLNDPLSDIEPGEVF